MAVTTGTIASVFNITSPLGPVHDSNNKAIVVLFIAFNITGTYAQADNSQLLTVPTFISSFMEDGRTYTLLDVALAAPGDEAGTPIGVKTLAISTSTITFELTGGDMSTEHANAVLGAMNRPICLVVSCQAV